MANVLPLTFEVRTGPPPADHQALDMGIMLGKAELPLTGSNDGPDSHRHVTITARIVAGGTAGHFRLKGIDDRCVDQGTIGRFGDGADLVLDRVELQADEDIRITPRFSRR